jgi:hypothetical protein
MTSRLLNSRTCLRCGVWGGVSCLGGVWRVSEMWCRWCSLWSVLRSVVCSVCAVVCGVWCLWCSVCGVVSVVCLRWCLWCGVWGVVSVLCGVWCLCSVWVHALTHSLPLRSPKHCGGFPDDGPRKKWVTEKCSSRQPVEWPAILGRVAAADASFTR